MKKNNIDQKSWLEFQKAVASLDPNKVAEMSFFAKKADKQYLFETFEEDFDDIVVVSVLEAKPTDLKIIKRNNVESEHNPFNILKIPKDINEVFTLVVNYYKSDEDDEYDDDDDVDKFDDEYDDEYEKDETFEDETGIEWSSDEIEFETDFEDDEIDEVIMKRTLVFGIIDGQLKYFGNFTTQ